MKPNFKLLSELAGMVNGIPANRFDIDSLICGEHTCWSIGCVIGYASLHPDWQERGLKWDRVMEEVTLNGDVVDYDTAAEELFDLISGDGRRLFGPAWNDDLDTELKGGGKHKQLFARRLVRFFDEHKEPVNPIYRGYANRGMPKWRKLRAPVGA